MTSSPPHRLWGLALAFAAVLILACSSGDDEGGGGAAASDAFIELESADETAHAALVEPEDLPGAGWEVTERDAAENEDSDFDRFAAEEPTCGQIAGLGNIGSIFGGEDADDAPSAARAQIELERSSGTSPLPLSLEVEIEVEEAVSDVQGGWEIIKDLNEADRTQECIAKVVNRLFTEQFDDVGIELTLAPTDASAAAPQGGASMAFLMTMIIEDVVSLDVVMEMHLWPYGNAKVSTLILGEQDSLSADLVSDLLEAVDSKIVAAEAAQ